MELLNATKMAAGYTLGLEPGGRELLVVVIKGTFVLEHQAPARLADQQVSLTLADEFEGEPGLSAPLHESDFAPRKPRCDVLLNGSAHAPLGRPVESMTVGLYLGRVQKSFRVLGDRVWKLGVPGPSPGDPAPFVKQRFSYGTAFGGVDASDSNPSKHKTFLDNPVGVGYRPVMNFPEIAGTPAPNTEALGEPVRSPSNSVRPMALGPIGRGWKQRIRYAGTYDQKWQDEVFPFLPADFDERYYQAAPEDQQIDHPSGGEEVVLVGLTPEGRTVFRLPDVEVPIAFYHRDGGRTDTQGTIDTVVIEPDQGRYTVSWRSSLALKAGIFEIRQVVAGRMSRAWHRARELGKTYYPSLAHLARAREAQAAALAGEEA